MGSTGDKLRQDINGSGRRLVSIGVWDVLSARVTQAAGANMVAPQSFQVAAARGLPDVGLLTPSDLLELCYKICDAVELPVLFDFESGFGGPGQAAYWARLFERAGVAAIHIDDLDVLTCPWIPGAERRLRRKEPQETKEIIARIADCRQHGLFIIARAHPLFDTSTQGFPDTEQEDEERLRQYVEAGADMVYLPQYVVARGDKEAVRRLHRSLGVPLFVQFNPVGYIGAYSSSNSLARLKFDDLFGLGAAIVNIPQVYPIAYKAFRDAAKEMLETRSAEGFDDRMLSLKEVLELVRYRDFEPR